MHANKYAKLREKKSSNHFEELAYESMVTFLTR